jgi:ribosomal protein L11
MEQNRKRKKIATTRSTPSANRAAPPPISGQASGQHGLNTANPRKTPNEKTRNTREHVSIPTRVEVHRPPSQNPLETTVKSPPSTYPSKQTANLSKGSATTTTKKSRGRLTPSKETHHPATPKKCDLMQRTNPKAIRKTSTGPAKSIGFSANASKKDERQSPNPPEVSRTAIQVQLATPITEKPHQLPPPRVRRPNRIKRSSSLIPKSIVLPKKKREVLRQPLLMSNMRPTSVTIHIPIAPGTLITPKIRLPVQPKRMVQFPRRQRQMDLRLKLVSIFLHRDKPEYLLLLFIQTK